MSSSDKAHQRDSILREFLDNEAAGGLVLMGATAAALLIAHSAFATSYFAALRLQLGPLDIQHWVNDGLMQSSRSSTPHSSRSRGSPARSSCLRMAWM